ncbi:hypothetical protein RBWH47_03380 [Rhodopirellula baltica WH47]|uniref:Uncharacterized protein n=1 Tax=Rhodopirellula baltica WH47 TaxID=991778 RepID=F2APM4_RHOBT|nr:hypothetical protein RBWH47_03380 [Rhodopirellula baltica WH47]
MAAIEAFRVGNPSSIDEPRRTEASEIEAVPETEAERTEIARHRGAFKIE